MDIKDKYKKVREKLKDGDIILCHSQKFLAKAIRVIDNSYYHHSGVVFVHSGRVFIMDSHPKGGTNPSYLSHRIEQKKWDDFTILRPDVGVKKITYALKKCFAVADKFIKYDLAQVFSILWWKITGKYKGDSQDKYICSEFTQYFCIHMGIESHFPKNLEREFFTPHDHYRLKDDFKIIE